MGRYSLTPLVEAMRFSDGESVARALGISGESLTRYTVLTCPQGPSARFGCMGNSPFRCMDKSLLTPRIMDRFWSKVDKTETCWLWNAGLKSSGYGAFWFVDHMWPAHRFLYEAVASVAADLELDHLCRVRSCVRPDHLEPVTHQENVRRGAVAVRSTCPQGHPYATLGIDGARRCRECNRREGRAATSAAAA